MKKLLTFLLTAAVAMPTLAAKKKTVTEEPKDPNEMVAYLFTYFNSNDPKDEQICYAISDDGYNYTPLNMGMPVIESDTIALTQCVRDPHILRCEDGKTFYMVVTDMRSAYGWSSNRGMVLLKSTDLINWQHSTINFPTRYTKEWKNVIRVWAPETIYDHKAGKSPLLQAGVGPWHLPGRGQAADGQVADARRQCGADEGGRRGCRRVQGD